MSVAELRKRLEQCLKLNANALRVASRLYCELMRRGEDVSEINSRCGLARHFPEIATNRLAPESIVAFADKSCHLRALVGLDLHSQRQLAKGATIKVVDPHSIDSDPVEMPFGDVSATLATRVIFGGKIRDPKEQRLAIRDKPIRPPHPRTYHPKFDAETGTICVGKLKCNMSGILDAIAESSGARSSGSLEVADEYVEERVRLTQDEYRALQESSRKAGRPPWDLLRKAAIAAGII